MLCVGTVLATAAAAQDRTVYDLAERCGRRAAEIFGREYGPYTRDGTQYSFNYRNHYNPKMNKCFLVLYTHSTNAEMETDGYDLYDVNERRLYGSYHDFRTSGYSVSDPPNVSICGIGSQRCRSLSEWKALISDYMGD